MRIGSRLIAIRTKRGGQLIVVAGYPAMARIRFPPGGDRCLVEWMRSRVAIGAALQEEGERFLMQLQGGFNFCVVHRAQKSCDDKGDETLIYALYR